MKTILVEARYNQKIILPTALIKKLPKKISLISSIQFVGQLHKIKVDLKKHNIEAIIAKGKQPYPGQVIGCDVSAALYNKDVEAHLSINSGEFHSLGVGLQTNKPVFVFNPLTKKHNILRKQDIDLYKKRKKGAYLKFLTKKNIGFLVSTKPGQNNLKTALHLKSKLTDKNCYIFIADELPLDKLEDFNFIDCWVNVACPRIDDKNMLTIEDMKELVLNITKISEIK